MDTLHSYINFLRQKKKKEKKHKKSHDLMGTAIVTTESLSQTVSLEIGQFISNTHPFLSVKGELF